MLTIRVHRYLAAAVLTAFFTVTSGCATSPDGGKDPYGPGCTGGKCDALNPENDPVPFPLIFTGPKASAQYFEQIDAFIRLTLGEAAASKYTIIIDDAAAVAQAVGAGLEQVDLSSMLNLTRALRRSARGMRRALSGYLLGPTAAEILAQAGED